MIYYKKRIEQFKQYPNMVKAYIKAGRKYIDTHPQSKLKEKYGDEYAYFYRNVFCISEQDFRKKNESMFGKPNYKNYLENYFNIKL